jgi:ribonuclease T2
MKTSVAALAAVLAVAPAVQASLYGQSKDNHSCVLVPDYKSCSAKAKPDLVDSCCVETFGGLVLLTQVRDRIRNGRIGSM